MKYRRICIQNHQLFNGDRIWTLVRGREYTTGPVKFGTCMVYFRGTEIKHVPSGIFAGAERVDGNNK